MDLRSNRAATESAESESATDRTSGRRLVYVRAVDLDQWGCRPFETIDILDLQDRPAGHVRPPSSQANAPRVPTDDR